MSESGSHEQTEAGGDAAASEELHGLTVEDDPDGTVDPAELAGTDDASGAEEELRPSHSEQDLED